MYISPKMNTYRRDFDETKYMTLLIKDDGLLEKYNEMWKKVKNSIKEEFDSEPVYNEKYVNARIKSHKWKVNTNFQNYKYQKKVLNSFASNFDQLCFYNR